MFLIAAGIFILFVAAYLVMSTAVVYHLYHYTLPGWTAVRIVVPVFFIFSLMLTASAAWFLFTIR